MITGIFNTNVCRPVLINITAAEVVSIGVGAEVLREAELSTQTNTYRKTFYAVVDRVAVYVSIVVGVVVNVSQFEVRVSA